MPYIKGSDRVDLRDALESVNPNNVGELNYCITVLVDKFITENNKNYSTLNSVVGVLECAKLELYRRIVAPYEDIKIRENGEVYDNV